MNNTIECHSERAAAKEESIRIKLFFLKLDIFIISIKPYNVMNVIIVSLIFNLWVSVTLAPDSHALKINFRTTERIEALEIGFIYRGTEYKVARVNNSKTESVWQDSFIWFSTSKWEEGDLKLAVSGKNNKQEIIIREQDISINDFGVLKSKDECDNIIPKTESKNYGDQYAWRMFGYDPQQTVYYPFSLNPPLEFKWRSNWPYWNHGWVTDITGCATYGKLFIGDGSNHLRAVDIETGQTIWSRITTANAMTSALCYGESLLFVGSLVGFTPDIDTTLYALDPMTGQVKWGKSLQTVQESPIIADTILIVPSYGFSKIFAFNLSGSSLWLHKAGFYSPVYWQGKIYHSDSMWGRILNSNNVFTGESLWSLIAPNVVERATVASNKVFFFATDTLFAIDVVTGNPILKISGFYNWLGPKVSAYDDKLFLSYGEYGTADTILTHVQSFSSVTGSLIWEKFVRPRKINGGWSANPLVTENNDIWVMNTDKIYIFNHNTGTTIGIETLPLSNTEEPALFSLIGYKNYIIGAHRDFMFAYKVDTAPISADTFQFYTFFDFINLNFSIFLENDDNVSLELYNLAGRFVADVFNGHLNKGTHLIPFYYRNLSQGIYFCILKTSNMKKTVKIPLIK